MKYKKNFLSLLCLLFSMTLFSQEKTITGTVSENGQPLPGVLITLKRTNQGSFTDLDGTYSIKAQEGDVLEFSFMGMQTQTAIVTAHNTINMQLNYDASVLDDVVIIAYSTAKKSSYTGSLTQINAEKFEKRALTHVLSALEGASPGVQISSSSGQPGDAPNFRIRGISSVNGTNAPLYVVDGVPFSGTLQSLASLDIESLTILKDASSTAIYGSRGANGVVMITTKTGKTPKEEFTLNASQGVISRSIPEYKRVNAKQYYPLMWEAYRNSLSMSGTTPLNTANEMASQNIYELLGYNPFNVPNDQIVGQDGRLNPKASLLYEDDLNWEDALSRTGIRQNIDFSYQGKSTRSNYYASLSYLKEDAYIQNSDFERITARVNINTQFKEWLKTGINLSGYQSDSNQAVDGVANSNAYVNPFSFIRNMGPIYPIYLHNPETGAYILDADGERIFDSGNRDEIRPAGASSGRHVIQETLLNKDRQRDLSISARTYAEFKFLDYFTFTANLALDKTHRNIQGYTNSVIGDAVGAGRAERNSTLYTGVTYNQLLNYSHQIKRHQINALLGHENFDYSFDRVRGTKTGQIVENNFELINFVSTNRFYSLLRNYSSESYFSRLEYNFDNKYFFSSSYRRDGSSKFSKENRWGNFWSLGASWRLDQENFIKNVEWISALKLRSSYGEVGNDSFTNHSDLSFYSYQALFELGINNGNEAGILAETIEAPKLKWEVNTQKDIAVEFSLFKHRIKATVEYYHRQTDELIFEVPNPLTVGLDTRIENIGSMYNRGFEFSLDTELIKTPKFTWNFIVNAATIKNQFTKLPQDEIISGSKKFVVGGSIYDYWLREWYGVDPADGAGLFIASDESVEVGATDLRTINGITVTTNPNNAKYNFVGNALPKLYGSFGSNFKYKGIQLDFLFTYQLGGKTYDSNYASLMHGGNYGNASSTDIENRWQQPGDNTSVPRLDSAQRTLYGSSSSRWLIDSSYLSLKQMTLSYDFDTDLTKKLGVEQVRLYANGENLFVTSKRKGLDVGQNFNGTTQNRFLPARIVSVGFNLKF
ncbi:SusC/RagA family TonB-linked outer membrane protein [Flavobacterium sp. NKUCC04_CG]|uniref:SusC/RagA family TonB-linked outer membrane protein n=1 Tax=Flavobacterium sp. NKUCC04_CG TaxID=2842121 RepID=UPI001C5B97F3|nr:SusC/RagA family TonB-linked outer membrane protein [Flavobacterium sp. NKUCC04_CG]MBW3518572.1 SusC/RagA family TonB-linked outer membrane protein [Flavobacterium sp. NKUCC04_CG]